MPRIVLSVAAVCLVVFTFTRSRLGENPRSRIITVERVVEAGTMSHDGSPFERSIDSVKVDGRRFSSKPPLYSLVMAGQAYVLRALTGLPFYEHRSFYVWTLVLLNQVLMYIALLWLGLRWARERKASLCTQGFLAAALSFGCLPFGYAVTLNNHTPTACFLFFAFYAVDRVLHRGGGLRWAILVGAAAGLATAYEPTAGIFMVLFLLLVARASVRAALIAAACAAIPLVITVATFVAITGSPLPFYMQPELYDYEGSYWRAPRGIDALEEPRWLYAIHVLIGHHGLFSLSPILALGAVGLWWSSRDRDSPRRLQFAAVIAGICVVIVYILIRTSNYGGHCIGMRWFAQFMPLMVLASIPVLERLQRSSRGRALTAVLLAISCAAPFEAMLHTVFNNGGWVYGLARVWGGS